jgi:hypothetical protein
MSHELDRYLRENRTRYTRDALTAQAIEAGHDPAALAEAWRRIDADEGGQLPMSPGRPPATVGGAVSGLVIGVVFVAASYSIIFGLPAGGLLVEIALSILVGIFVWRYLRRHSPVAGETFGWVALVGCVVPLLVVGAVAGYCLVTGFKLTGN